MNWEDKINKVWCGDGYELAKAIQIRKIDLLLTDPPYGMKLLKNDGTFGIEIKAKARKYKKIIGDEKPIEVKDFMKVTKNQIIFGGNFIANKLSPSRGWIVWDKLNDRDNNYSDCELIYTNFDKRLKLYRYLWWGMLVKYREKRFHPAQKPLPLIIQIIKDYSKPNDLIFDPFMGSWTTAVACIETGRDFIGAELYEEYCEIGRKRIEKSITRKNKSFNF